MVRRAYEPAPQSHLDEVVLGIVSDADEWQPFCLNLVTQMKGGNLDFHLLGFWALGQIIEGGLPLRFLQVSRCHKDPLFCSRWLHALGRIFDLHLPVSAATLTAPFRAVTPKSHCLTLWSEKLPHRQSELTSENFVGSRRYC